MKLIPNITLHWDIFFLRFFIKMKRNVVIQKWNTKIRIFNDIIIHFDSKCKYVVNVLLTRQKVVKTKTWFILKGTLRIDESGPLQTNFSSTSGENVKVVLAIPVIANPPPQASDITWMGPTDYPIKSTVSRRDSEYKHWINTSVPVKNHSNFGYYVVKYRNKTIQNISINAQGMLYRL